MEPSEQVHADRVWAAAACALVGAVMAIGQGLDRPVGILAVVAVLALGLLAIVEARSPARLNGWMRSVPYALLLLAAVGLLATGRTV